MMCILFSSIKNPFVTSQGILHLLVITTLTKECSISGLVVYVIFKVQSLIEFAWTLFQFKQAEETAKKLDLDGLVVIGGDDSNTNACLLAENFR